MKRDSIQFEREKVWPGEPDRALDQQRGRHSRLERELARAFSMTPWPGALVNRLADDLADAERMISSLEAGLQAADSRQ
jgi:hypothetical protein